MDLWRRDLLGVAELLEWSKFVETIPHVDKFSIFHLEKNICPGSGCAVPCEISKRSKCMETKVFALEFTSSSYETLK